MKRNEEAMLRILRCAVHGEATPDPVFSAEEWAALLRLSEAHGLLPLVYDAAYRCASFQQLEPETRKAFQTRAIRRAISQIRQSSEFLTLLLHAQAQGLDPIVLKGITVRSLYPRPMLRPSVDEDLLVRPGEAAAYHRFFLSEGLVPDDPEAELSTAAELSYHRPESPTYIELHLHPFPPESEAYGDCNALFAGASERAVRVQIEDVALRALAPTEHLLYLLCHAYKHFLHSGVGIRQVCDIGMFAQRYGEEIDWSRVLAGCAEIRIEHLAAALFRIAERQLGFAMPAAFAAFAADEEPLLEDILAGGLYGTQDENRLHSGTITLDAVAAERQGRGRKGLSASLFPSASTLSGRYPYLKKRPWLLPAAWLQRFAGYLKNRETSAADSMRIGDERIRLLQQYGVLDSAPHAARRRT